MIDFSEQVAIVTGGGRRLGHLYAIELAPPSRAICREIDVVVVIAPALTALVEISAQRH